MNQSQINQLRAAYSSLKRITIEDFQRLKATLNNLKTSDLDKLVNARITFVSTAANSLMCDRKAKPESARWEHAIDTITDSLLAEHVRHAVA